MSILSVQFFVVIPILLLYLLIPEKYLFVRKLFLLIVSIAFYMSWKPISVLYLIWVATISYCGGLITERGIISWPSKWGFVILTLFPLAFIKFFGPLFSPVSIFFPVGLSFYTLQALGYIFDVYNKRCDVVHSALDYFLFISFFPQLSSGPIGRAGALMPQLAVAPRPSASDIGTGCRMVIWGCALKLVVADRLGMSVDAIYTNYLYYSGADCLLAAVLYCFQIYADFSGYSLIAIGIARCFGVHLMDNFRQPYFAYCIGDFWRRWHISLSQWLRDYIYIPLGGSRCSRSRICANIIITFIVSGLWHGVSWNYLIWGLYLGVMRIIEKGCKLNVLVQSRPNLRVFFCVLNFCSVCFSWIIFRSPSLAFLKEFLSHLFRDFGIIKMPDIGGATMVLWFLGISLVLFHDFWGEFRPVRRSFPPVVKAIECSLLLAFIVMFGVLDGGSFIYVNF